MSKMTRSWPPAPSPALGGLQPSMTLAITAKAKALRAAGQEVFAFSAGEPDFDTPEHIKEAAIQALRDGKTKYTPASGLPELREAIAEKLKQENGIPCAPDQVIVAPGAKFSVFSAIAALCGPGDQVLLPTPAWLSYAEMIRAAGAEPVFVPSPAEEDFRLNPDTLRRQITPRTKLLVLNTPTNPTGGVYDRPRLEAILETAVANGFMVLADEIYEKLVYDGVEHVSIASLGPEAADHTVTVNGFSKAFSMTGWRLGYSVSPPWLSGRIAALQSHSTSNATTFAQYGALAALRGPQAPIEAMRQAFEQRRNRIFELLQAIPGMKVRKPRGAFYIFPEIRELGLDSMRFAERLLAAKNVAVIPGKPFNADGNIRLSYACALEIIEEGCRRLAEFCAEIA